MPRKTTVPEPEQALTPEEQTPASDPAPAPEEPEPAPASKETDSVIYPEALSGPSPEPQDREPSSGHDPPDDGSILTLRSRDVGLTGDAAESRDWGYLASAARRRQILSGVVSELVYSGSGPQACAVDFEGLRVLIPYREMTLEEWPSGEDAPSTVNAMMRRMLGATVDFIPLAVDIHERVAVGSRKAAMLERQARYYESGLIQPGVRVACRVLAVGNRAITVEACGVDTVINAREVSWSWFSDITELYASGATVVARVMRVARDRATGLYSAVLSVRAATDNPDRSAFSKLTLNSVHFGTVTGVNSGVYFIRLQSGVNAKTKIYRCRDRPGKLDTVSFLVNRLDEKHLVAYGFITRVIKRYSALG